MSIKKFTENRWGFDLGSTNPFWVALYNLRGVAKKGVGEENVLDLSRGDPGYGFSPNVRGREFFSFLIWLDTIFNNFNRHFVHDEHDFVFLKNEIETATREHFSPKVAEKNLRDLDFFISEALRISRKQNLNWDERQILFETFKYANVSGGRYGNPVGEKLPRAVVADFYSKNLNEKIFADDLVFARGVSDGIGTFFQLLDEKEGIGFLKKGNAVVTASPTYSPYNLIFKNRGLKVLSIELDPETGAVEPESLAKIRNYPGEIKVFCLIDPNNPTGFAIDDNFKKEIAAIAEQKNSIILTDEVYFPFLKNAKSIFSFAPHRTVRLDARSKIERSTGLRFGDFLLPPKTNGFISREILGEFLPDGIDFKKAVELAKAPGGTKGEFMHTSFVSLPSQFLGICQILFGKKEREKYVRAVEKNVFEFARILNLSDKKHNYYTVFDLNKIACAAKRDLPAEEKFSQLAQRGVVLIPANLFFSEISRAKKDCKNFARACLPNLTFAKVQKAAKIIRDFLGS